MQTPSDPDNMGLFWKPGFLAETAEYEQGEGKALSYFSVVWVTVLFDGPEPRRIDRLSGM